MSIEQFYLSFLFPQPPTKTLMKIFVFRNKLSNCFNLLAFLPEISLSLSSESEPTLNTPLLLCPAFHTPRKARIKHPFSIFSLFSYVSSVLTILGTLTIFLKQNTIYKGLDSQMENKKMNYALKRIALFPLHSPDKALRNLINLLLSLPHHSFHIVKGRLNPKLPAQSSPGK